MLLKSLKPINETKYLSVENAWRYRAIMRVFYINDKRYRHWLNKEDVYQALKGEEAFSEYTLEMCAQDLEALYHWGNLHAVQDSSKALTYKQFVNKQFRYQMTEYAIEIERMTVRLENLFVEGGSLEPTLMERLKSEIKQLTKMSEADAKTAGGWWQALMSDFQRLNQSYQDYIRDWSGAKAEELLKTKHFLIYKEKLVDYLRHFIKALQQHGYEIKAYLNEVEPTTKKTLFKGLTAFEMDIPRVDMEALNEQDVYNNIQGKFESLESFFVGTASRESELELILTMTNEIIRRITRYAATILEQINQYSGRKEEYKTLIRLFNAIDDVDEAHCLSAQVFGVASYRHFVGELTRETESIYASIYDEAPLEVVLSPRIRTFREKIKKTAITEHTEDKKRQREAVLKAREEENQLLLQYMADGELDLSDLTYVPVTVRRHLLKWIQKASTSARFTAVTEQGKSFEIINPKETRYCTLSSEDGNLYLPAYRLKFKGE